MIFPVLKFFHGQITALTSEGEGITSLDGYKIFVEGALPGEEILFSMKEKRKNFGRGQLVKINIPSPDRQMPICPLFQKCGGCQIMHLSYEKQLEAKQQRVQEALKRIGGFEDVKVPLCIPSPLPLNYRNKIQLPVEGDLIGLFQKGSHQIIPLDKCHIHNHLGEKVFSQIKPYLKAKSLRYLVIKNTTKESLIILVTDGSNPKEIDRIADLMVKNCPSLCGIVEMINTQDNNVILSSNMRTISGRSFIFENLLQKKMRISASSFFQVNTWQAGNMISYVLEKANIQKNEILWDAFCGVGTFSLFVADFAEKVIGSELSSFAIDDAQENARLNHQTNLSFYCAPAQDFIDQIAFFHTALLNPPRKGCDLKLIEQLRKKNPEKIIYVSCDPATLARDLSLLCHEKKYHLESIQPFDMFPQTMHVETIAFLTAHKNHPGT